MESMQTVHNTVNKDASVCLQICIIIVLFFIFWLYTLAHLI